MQVNTMHVYMRIVYTIPAGIVCVYYIYDRIINRLARQKKLRKSSKNINNNQFTYNFIIKKNNLKIR